MFRITSGALQYRDYRLFFYGQLISLIGSWMQSIGQSWLILNLTGSPLKLGVITTLQFLPMMLLSLFAGAIADRLPKKRVILVTQSIFMMLALILAVLVYTERVQFWHVAVMALMLGLVNTLDLPARQVFIHDMVGRENIGSAVALNSAVFNGARIAGPALAGIAIAQFGIASAFFMNGLSYVAVIAALLLVRTEGLPVDRKNGPILAEVKEGLLHAWRNRLLLFLLLLTLFVGLFVINFGVLVPLLAQQVLQQGAQGYGGLMSAMGAGALLASILKATRNRSDEPLPAIVVASLSLCLFTTAVFLVHSVLSASVLLFGIGFSMVFLLTSLNTKVQMNAPDHLRGRVLSLFTLANMGVAPLGAMFSGSIAEAYGVPAGFLAGGGIGLVAVLCLLLWWLLTGRRTSVSS